MAVTWTEFENFDGYARKNVVKTWTTHEGLVVSPRVGQEARVMSDVWDTMFTCEVWDPEKRAAETLVLFYADMGLKSADVVVDAPAGVLAEVAAQKAAAEVARRARERASYEAAALEAARKVWDRPAKGKVMEVVRGRKVKPGTVGEVFWLDDPRNPSRVGLALSGRKDARGYNADVAWVDAAYLRNTAPMAV